MDDAKQDGSIFSVREWDSDPVATLTIHAKYLNYDVSDDLKEQLREQMESLLERGTRHFVLDLTRVSIVDSCGVSLLIGLHNLVTAASGQLYLSGITHFLQKIFRMMHLDQFFQVIDVEDQVREVLPATS